MPEELFPFLTNTSCVFRVRLTKRVKSCSVFQSRLNLGIPRGSFACPGQLVVFVGKLSKQGVMNLRSQFVTSRRGGARYYPMAFTNNLLNIVEDAPFIYRGIFIPDTYDQFVVLVYPAEIWHLPANRYFSGCRISCACSSNNGRVPGRA